MVIQTRFQTCMDFKLCKWWSRPDFKLAWISSFVNGVTHCTYIVGMWRAAGGREKFLMWKIKSRNLMKVLSTSQAVRSYRQTVAQVQNVSEHDKHYKGHVCYIFDSNREPASWSFPAQALLIGVDSIVVPLFTNSIRSWDEALSK